MSNISAGIGRGQMFILKKNIQRRKKIQKIYSKLLNEIPGFSVLQNPSEKFDSNFWLTCLMVDKDIAGISAVDICNKLTQDNIECRHLWKPLHLQPVYKESPYYGNGTCEKIFENGLCLPSGANLTDEDIFYVVNEIKKLLEN